MTTLLPNPNPLLTVSLVLVAGMGFGALARRIHLPAVTGQILVGILIGPSVLGLFDLRAIHDLGPLIDFALGLMAVAVGSHLYLRRLAHAFKRLALLLVLEATVTPLVVFLAVASVPGTDGRAALLLATIAVSTAPATILALVKETRSRGIFVRTLVAAVALNNLACIFLFELAHTAALATLSPETGHTTWSVLLAPFREVLLSALLGGGVGGLLVIFTSRVVRPDRLAAFSMVAILITVGLGQYLGISTLLSCLFLGMALANLTPDKEEIGHEVFANFESAIFAIFFTVAGMELRFDYLGAGGKLALLVFAGRFGGKLLASRVAMRWAGATDRVRRYLGFALIPQAGLAVGLMLLVTEDPAFASMRDLFLAVVLTVVLLNEIVGPVLTRFALARSGDFGKDRARLIDFLHEEHILTGLRAKTREQAIEQLTDHLIQTHHLKVDRERLLQGFLAREKQQSTCVGNGLAIPHGPLEEGSSMVGVMGISSEGLAFDTPDGLSVHCMVLLATPADQYDRHLEVLAALARAIGKDRSIQQQLYHCSSPAHAYELLHADEESEDFNYFLEEES